MIQAKLFGSIQEVNKFLQIMPESEFVDIKCSEDCFYVVIYKIN